MKDPLTGNSFASEVTKYQRYHGLSPAQSAAVMALQSHAERDEACNRFIDMNAKSFPPPSKD